MNPKIKYIIAMVAVAGGIFTLQGCQKVEVKKPVACTEEAKVCPDGSTVGRTGPDCSFAPCPVAKPPVVPVEPPKDPAIEPKPSGETSGKTAPYGKPLVMRVGDSVAFSDGMTLKLKEINDSRCPAGVQCIWQGELSPLFVATQNSASDEVRLGTVSGANLSLKGRTYTLVDATETSATVQVDAIAIP